MKSTQHRQLVSSLHALYQRVFWWNCSCFSSLISKGMFIFEIVLQHFFSDYFLNYSWRPNPSQAARQFVNKEFSNFYLQRDQMMLSKNPKHKHFGSYLKLIVGKTFLNPEYLSLVCSTIVFLSNIFIYYICATADCSSPFQQMSVSSKKWGLNFLHSIERRNF